MATDGLTVTLLALLATWSLTQLATRDVITARYRAGLRRWLRARRHRQTFVPYEGVYLCSCGYETGDQDAFVDHIVVGRVEATQGWAYKLTTCPWCVSFYIAAVVGLSAAWLGDTFWWQVTAFALGARVFTGATVTKLGPPPDDDEDIADDPL